MLNVSVWQIAFTRTPHTKPVSGEQRSAQLGPPRVLTLRRSGSPPTRRDPSGQVRVRVSRTGSEWRPRSRRPSPPRSVPTCRLGGPHLGDRGQGRGRAPRGWALRGARDWAAPGAVAGGRGRVGFPGCRVPTGAEPEGRGSWVAWVGGRRGRRHSEWMMQPPPSSPPAPPDWSASEWSRCGLAGASEAGPRGGDAAWLAPLGGRGATCAAEPGTWAPRWVRSRGCERCRAGGGASVSPAPGAGEPGREGRAPGGLQAPAAPRPLCRPARPLLLHVHGTSGRQVVDPAVGGSRGPGPRCRWKSEQLRGSGAAPGDS